MSAAGQTINLNEDVLREILSWLPGKALFRVMGACHAFQTLGLPLLLARPRHVNSTTLNDFHAFMVMTAPSSFQLLRTLNVHWPISSSELIDYPWKARKIWTILVAARGLTTLHIAPAVLFADARIPATVRALPLRRLEVLSEPVAHAQALPIYDGPTRRPRHQLEEEGQVYLPIPQTVEHFVFRLVKFRSTVAYPQIKRFVGGPWVIPSICLLVRLFPNVRTLELTREIDPLATAESNHAYLVGCRTRNLDFQQDHPTAAWSSLACLRASSMVLFALGLQSKVTFLSLCIDVALPSLRLMDMLPCLRPLCLQQLDLVSHGDVEQLPAFFASGVIQGLQRFTVEIGIIDTVAALAQLDVALSALLDAVRGSRLRMLGCRICHGGEPPLNGAVFANPLYLLDNELFARRVMDAAPPTLTSLRLAVGPRLIYDPVSTYWTISRREGGQKQLGRVPDDDKSATSAIDEMCLTEEAKANWPCPDWNSSSGYGMFV